MYNPLRMNWYSVDKRMVLCSTKRVILLPNQFILSGLYMDLSMDYHILLTRGWCYVLLKTKRVLLLPNQFILSGLYMNLSMDYHILLTRGWCYVLQNVFSCYQTNSFWVDYTWIWAWINIIFCWQEDGAMFFLKQNVFSRYQTKSFRVYYSWIIIFCAKMMVSIYIGWLKAAIKNKMCPITTKPILSKWIVDHEAILLVALHR
jgi:hypothetical protein